MSDCKMELCPNWSGDGNVCPCAVFGLEPPEGDYMRGYREGQSERQEHHDSTWKPQGAWSEFERGWNDGYNSEPPRDA